MHGEFCDKQSIFVPRAADGICTVTTDKSNPARITGSVNKMCLSEVTQSSEGSSGITLPRVAEKTTPAKD